MPISLDARHFDNWLDPEMEVVAAKALLSDNMGPDLSGRRVRRAVNASQASGADLLDEIQVYRSTGHKEWCG